MPISTIYIAYNHVEYPSNYSTGLFLHAPHYTRARGYISFLFLCLFNRIEYDREHSGAYANPYLKHVCVRACVRSRRPTSCLW